jgi:chromosome segregation ATPase
MELQATGERLRQERQSQLDRLAEQQRTLKELAEQIQKSMDQNRELLGRLDKTVDEMESVSKSIERGEVDPDLVRREQRILSRMLDAQRSVHTRDYEQKRESVTAEDIFSRSLGENPDGPDAQSLRDEIRKAMQLKVPGEFEDLIKLYFRALAEESASPAGNS